MNNDIQTLEKILLDICKHYSIQSKLRHMIEVIKEQLAQEIASHAATIKELEKLKAAQINLERTFLGHAGAIDSLRAVLAKLEKPATPASS